MLERSAKVRCDRQILIHVKRYRQVVTTSTPMQGCHGSFGRLVRLSSNWTYIIILVPKKGGRRIEENENFSIKITNKVSINFNEYMN